MASPRDIRRRIKSVTGTVQITRAMEMVAASKMRRAQQASLTTRPFGHLLYRIQRRATAHARDFTHPLLEAREVHRRAVLLVGTDRGLCGALNNNLFRVAGEFDPETTVYIAVGRRAAQFIARTRRHLVGEFTITDSPRFAEARPIASFARDLFVKGEVSSYLSNLLFTVLPRSLGLYVSHFVTTGSRRRRPSHWQDRSAKRTPLRTQSRFSQRPRDCRIPSTIKLPCHLHPVDRP